MPKCSGMQRKNLEAFAETIPAVIGMKRGAPRSIKRTLLDYVDDIAYFTFYSTHATDFRVVLHMPFTEKLLISSMATFHWMSFLELNQHPYQK